MGNLVDLPPRAAAQLRERLAALDMQHAKLQAERTAILARHEGWLAGRERMGDLEAWCRQVASRLGGLSHSDKRMALLALGVEVKVHEPGHTPRFVISAQIPLLAGESEANLMTKTARS